MTNHDNRNGAPSRWNLVFESVFLGITAGTLAWVIQDYPENPDWWDRGMVLLTTFWLGYWTFSVIDTWNKRRRAAWEIRVMDGDLGSGLRFSTSVSGRVTGITAHGAGWAPGSLFGRLVDGDGKVLATGVFSADNGDRRTLRFDRPVEVQPGVEYRVEYGPADR